MPLFSHRRSMEAQIGAMITQALVTGRVIESLNSKGRKE